MRAKSLSVWRSPGWLNEAGAKTGPVEVGAAEPETEVLDAGEDTVVVGNETDDKFCVDGVENGEITDAEVEEVFEDRGAVDNVWDECDVKLICASTGGAVEDETETIVENVDDWPAGRLCTEVSEVFIL